MSKILLRNWGYKIISIVLALLMWLLVSNQVRSENAQQVLSLQEKSVPANLIVTSKLLSTVTVRLQSVGSFNTSKDLVATIDLSGAVKGEKSYPVTVNVPPGVRIVSVEPANVSVTLDELVEKTMPVTLKALGNVAEGYETGTPVIKPSTIVVRGPAEKLNQIAKVLIEVNLANASEPLQTSSAVRFNDAGGNPITGPDPARPIVVAQPQEISVLIPVVKRELSSKLVPVKATSKGNPGVGYTVGQIVVVPTNVKLLALSEKLKTIESINAGAIDVTGATQDIVVEIKPENLGLPAGVSLEAGAKISVIVRLKANPIERVFKGIPLSPKNAVDTLKVDFSTQTGDITVRGMPDILNALKDTDIRLSVDVASLNVGVNNNVQVTAQLPTGVEAVNPPSPPNVTVTITSK